MFRLAATAALTLGLCTGTAAALEFWIAPESYRASAEAGLRAELRLGARFQDAAARAVPADAAAVEEHGRFEIVTAAGRVLDADVTPVLAAPDLPEGLAVVVHEAAPETVTWADWQRFSDFADRTGLAEQVEAAGIGPVPGMALEEDCIRYAKALVAIGHGRGADALTGMRAEFLALANPYTDDLAGVMPVQLWLDGAPLRNGPVELHARPVDGDGIARESFRTDTNGVVLLPVEPGTEYLVSAIAIEAADADGTAWRTLRASLTFEVPEPPDSP
jgi:hypothetical protein